MQQITVDNLTILNNLTTAVVVIDQQLQLSYINHAAEILLAVSGQRIQHKALDDLFRNPDEFQTNLLHTASSGHPLTKREAELTLINGQQLVLDYTITPLNEHDACADSCTLLVELFPKDRLLRISKEESILAKQESSKLLIRGLAHEIKNPLGGIRGAAQLLSRELPSSDLQEYIHVIIEEADRLRDLVDRMLGPMRPPQMNPINIHVVLEHVCNLITAEASGGIDVIRDYDPSIPELPGDAQQLIQAVLNIMHNALQALKASQQALPRTITIRSRIVRQFTIASTCHRLVCQIDINDNGPGIPAHLIDTIFYPMVSGKAEGTGLGLSIAQAIISQHKGLIRCSSEPGNTTFTIYLPFEHHQGSTHEYK
ncbi:nitrogen regulation protein NR(II) [Zooshikella sp. RANM57]|uniref:nitrogen regulation protein NR(II) n=1 Tax=Zooshikella sp. RANM57 TaxID=3425863 RepID=UPI003D6F406D